MFRFKAAVAVFILMAAASRAPGQGNEPAWQELMSQALYTAGAHDYAKSERAFLQAVQAAEQFGPRDARLGATLNSLGLVYRAQNKFGDAEKVYRRALTILEAAYGESIDVANIHFNIANVLFDQGRQGDALDSARRAVDIYQRLLGDGSLKTAAALCLEGDSYRMLKRYAEAEGPLKRCADIREADNGLESSDVADALYSLALTYIAEGKLAAAEPRLRLIEKIREKTLGITSPLLAQTMEEHAAVLKSMGRDLEAGKLITISAAIRRNQQKSR